MHAYVSSGIQFACVGAYLKASLSREFTDQCVDSKVGGGADSCFNKGIRSPGDSNIQRP